VLLPFTAASVVVLLLSSLLVAVGAPPVAGDVVLLLSILLLRVGSTIETMVSGGGRSDEMPGKCDCLRATSSRKPA
jgi:hypothetical protein